ncbi:MAG: ABZJ_00895 family protein [Pseudomonadota bacterium]
MSISPWRYGLWFAGFTFALLAVVMGARALLGLNLSPALAVVLPALAAAMIEGSRYAKTTREPVPSPWTDALVMTGIALVMLIVVLVPLLFGPLGLPATWGLTAILFCAVLWFGTNRLFLTLGARSEWAAQDRRGA